MQWWFSFAATSLSCVALAASLWCWWRVQKLLRGASAKSLLQLSTEVAELLSACESLGAQQRKLSSRVGMREVRERRAEPAADSPTAAVDRDKLRELARARGLIR